MRRTSEGHAASVGAGAPAVGAPTPVERVWRGMLPPQVVVVAATEAMWAGGATDRELLAVEGAVEGRRREYRAGRGAARAALGALGVRGFDLLTGAAREPLWPRDVVGSITHAGAHCCVAVARRGALLGIGIDLEADRPLDPALVPIVCTEDERRLLAQLRARGPAAWATVAFSAKEAFYKAYFPATRTFLEFHDAHVRVRPERGEFSVELTNESVPPLFGRRRVRGRFVVRQGLVFTAVAIAADP